jgi:L-lactate dehydrogenase complex protein LldG
VSDARATVMARIRTALADVPAGEPARWNGPGAPGSPDAYERARPLDRLATIELLAERIADYRAQVVRCGGEEVEIASAVARSCAEHGARRIVVPHDLPGGWLPAGLEPLRDDPAAPLAVETLDGADGVLTGSALAIAETGTIAFDGGPGQGRRAITLVPDLHVCVVRAGDVCGTVPEGFERLAAAAAEGRPITLVSGPSATSDIEFARVEGVHGPRRLVVLLAG